MIELSPELEAQLPQTVQDIRAYLRQLNDGGQRG